MEDLLDLVPGECGRLWSLTSNQTVAVDIDLMAGSEKSSYHISHSQDGDQEQKERQKTEGHMQKDCNQEQKTEHKHGKRNDQEANSQHGQRFLCLIAP
jgi:hypothetical protein